MGLRNRKTKTALQSHHHPQNHSLEPHSFKSYHTLILLSCTTADNSQQQHLGTGNLTLQFKLASEIDYLAESRKKAMGRTKQQYIQDKIRNARIDFAV
jgi:hypothetical protein